MRERTKEIVFSKSLMVVDAFKAHFMDGVAIKLVTLVFVKVVQDVHLKCSS